MACIKLGVPPKGEYSNIVALNDNELIIASHSDGIYKYISYKDQWKLFMKYPDNYLSFDEYSMYENEITLAVDHTFKQLYLSVNGCQKLSIIDLESMHFTDINVGYTYSGYGANCIVGDSKLHLIGGRGNKHKIFNKTSNRFDKVSNIWSCRDRSSKIPVISSGLIYISSQHTLLVLGGQEYHRGCNCGDTCDPDCSLDEIWVHTLNTTQWEKVGSLPSSLQDFGIVLTSNEKYVIIIGGRCYVGAFEIGNRSGSETNEYSDSIYVLDVKDMKFSKSIMKSPVSMCKASIIGNDLRNKIVLNGYIRNIVHLPFDIIDIISNFYSNEYVHIMERNGTKHWKISIDDILKFDI